MRTGVSKTLGTLHAHLYHDPLWSTGIGLLAILEVQLVAQEQLPKSNCLRAIAQAQLPRRNCPGAIVQAQLSRRKGLTFHPQHPTMLLTQL